MIGVYPGIYTYPGSFLWPGEWTPQSVLFTEPFDDPDPEGA